MIGILQVIADMLEPHLRHPHIIRSEHCDIIGISNTNISIHARDNVINIYSSHEVHEKIATFDLNHPHSLQQIQQIITDRIQGYVQWRTIVGGCLHELSTKLLIKGYRTQLNLYALNSLSVIILSVDLEEYPIAEVRSNPNKQTLELIYNAIAPKERNKIREVGGMTTFESQLRVISEFYQPQDIDKIVEKLQSIPKAS